MKQFGKYLFFSLLLSGHLNAQTWTFVQPLGNEGGESCQALSTDQQNNIYLSGGFNDDFQLGNSMLSPLGDIDIYLTKLNTNGDIQWTVSGGSLEDDEVVDIAIDNENNVYWTGMYWISADFGDTILNVESSSRAIFIIKYTSAGEMLWAKSFDGTGLKQISDITTDENNNLYLTGYFENTLMLDEFNLTALSDTDMFVAKMTSTGDLIWASKAGLAGENLGISVAVDKEQNVLVGGHFQGTIAFQQDTIQSNTPDRDVFISKFDSNGEAIWGKKAGGVYPSELSKIALTGDDNIYATGTFLGVLKLTNDIELQTNGFNKDIFLLHYDKNGTAIWAKSMGGTSDEEANDMALNNDYIAIAGNFKGNMIVDNFNISHNSNLFNGFVAGFSLAGDTRWLQKMTSSELLLAEKVAINNDEQVWTAGVFTQTATFNQVDYPSKGSFDIFIAGLNDNLTPIQKITESHDFSFFPNPATQSIFIEAQTEDFSIKITALNGQVIKEFKQIREISLVDVITERYKI